MQCKCATMLPNLKSCCFQSKLFNLTSLQVEKEGKIISETATDAALKPQLQLTENFCLHHLSNDRGIGTAEFCQYED